MKKDLLKLFLLILVLVISGCSSGKHEPSIPKIPDNNLDIPSIDISYDTSNHNLLGTWTATFDIESLTASIVPNRSINTHYNVTSIIPDPIIQVNSWDTVAEVVDVDVMLYNPFLTDAYDVRLIIYTDDAGHGLMNPDDWTHLYDIPEGLYSNPFKAYAKHDPNRKFGTMSYHTENLLIKCPNGNFTVQFAVDASHPGNCEEPYEISNFRQQYLADVVGASAWIYVDVFDWQNDVSEVKIDCQSIAGANDITFTHNTENTWKLELINNNGAPPGEYGAILFAKSSDSGQLELIDRVTITVSTEGIPLNPINVGYYDGILGQYADLCVENGYLYAVDETQGLHVLNISNPQHLDILSKLQLSSPSLVDVSGNYACVVYSAYPGEYSKLMVVDVSDPFDMELKGSVEFNEHIFSVSVDENFAIAAGWSSLSVIDLNSPDNPVVVGRLDSLNLDYCKVYLIGKYVYFVDSRKLKVMDISDPFNPLIVDEHNPIGIGLCSRYTMAIENSILCLSSQGVQNPTCNGFLEVINISDPSNLTRLGYIYFTSSGIEHAEEYMNEIAISGNYIVASRHHWYGVEAYETTYVLDITNPSDIVIRSSIEAFKFSTCEIFDNNCYVIRDRPYIYDDEFGVIEISEPDYPTYHPASATLSAELLAVSENGYACVQDSASNLCVFDVNDPENPQMRSHIYSDNFTIRDIEFSGDYVFLAGSSSSASHGVAVLDVSNPDDPYFLTFIDTAGEVRNIVISNNCLYAAAGTDGLLIFNISDPHNPSMIGSINPGNTIDVDQQEDYAYVVTSDEGLIIIDVSNPSDPFIIGQAECFSPVHLEVQGNLAFAYRHYTLMIFNIIWPPNPIEITEFPYYIPFDSGMKVSGDYVYLGSSENDILDIRTPSNPIFLSQLDVPSNAVDIEIIGNFAYITCGHMGLQINKLW